MSFFFFFKQKTAYEMRISDWSSDVCSSDLIANVIWDEYAVCRLTWRFAPLQSGQHAESVIAATAGARSRANEKIKAYRHHGDHLRILKEAGSELCAPIKMIAYLVEIGNASRRERMWLFV